MAELNRETKTEQENLCPDGYKVSDGYTIPNEWNVVRFNSLFKRLMRKNTENNQNVLTISAQQGLVSQTDYYNTLYASENKEGYTLLHRGDFSYNKSYSSDYAYGAIKRLDAYDAGIVSPIYICFTPEKGTNSDFYIQYFEAGCFNREIYKIAQEGARNHGLLNVSTEDFFNSSLVFPPLDEQECIAEILMQCDKVIELKQKRIEEEKKKKKWIMRHFFGDENATGWTIARYSDVCKFLNGRAYKQEELLACGKYPVLRVGNLFTKGDWYYSDLELTCDKYISDGDLIYAWSASFGPHVWDGEKVIYHYHIWKVIPEENVDKNYLYQYFLYDVDLLVREQQGGTMSHITKETMEKRVCRYPNLNDQRKIAGMLSEQDKLIALLEEEINEWQKQKKGLTQMLLTGMRRVN